MDLEIGKKIKSLRKNGKITLEELIEKLNKVLKRYKITAIVGNPRLGNSYHDEEVIDTMTTIRKTVTRYYADVFLHIK